MNHPGHRTDVSSASLYPAIETYLRDREAELGRIDSERRADLERLAAYVRDAQSSADGAKLTFVCTHNSRRSHLAQLWAAAAAARCGLRVETYSGGTEATAFNPRAVAAVRRAGLRINDDGTSVANPRYDVRFADDAAPQTCFSKVFDESPNPAAAFAAVMVCDDADRNCPYVPGAEARFALPYVDPKIADDTPEEASIYDERCEQIAREMLFVMTRAAAERG